MIIEFEPLIPIQRKHAPLNTESITENVYEKPYLDFSYFHATSSNLRYPGAAHTQYRHHHPRGTSTD
ncbi:MAG: hypothetical protein MJA29_13295, partial [Candidatus Omnitrophica bacterium]|nr:hypothetical protein [Candidatus Omnitrophota bacterium]